MIKFGAVVGRVALPATRSLGTYSITTWEERQRSLEKQHFMKEEGKFPFPIDLLLTHLGINL